MSRADGEAVSDDYAVLVAVNDADWRESAEWAGTDIILVLHLGK